MLLTIEQTTLVQEWNEAKQQLKVWQEKESRLRDQIVADCFDNTKTEGSESLDIGLDWKLRATKKFNYNLSNKDGALTNILAGLPSVIAQNLIRWNPDLNLSMYRKLDAPTQQLFAPVLTIKAGKPTLELVAPD